MQQEKRIMVVFGLSVLLMIVPAGTFAGQWLVNKTFTDNFNRANVTGTTNLGPGWVNGTNSTSGAYYDRFSIDSFTAYRYDGGSVVFATNVTLGAMYQVSIDLQYDIAAGNGWDIRGNQTYMGTNSYVVTIHHPSLRRIMLRVWDNNGLNHDLASYPVAASLTHGAWYRYTLYRSNDYIRATFVGSDANLDTGWLSNYIDQVRSGGFGGTGGNNNQKFDNFSLTNYNYVEKGTIISIR